MNDEDTLLDSTASEAPPETTTESEGWRWAEGVGGEGERPEWFADKFNSVSDQAKAYRDLEKKFGGFVGAPEEYTISMPEGIEAEFIEGDPLLDSFKTAAKESGMSQETFTNLLHLWANGQYESLMATKAMELQALGQDRDKRIQSVMEFASANFDPEGLEDLRQTVTSAAAMRTVERLMGMTREAPIPGAPSPSPGITKAELQARIGDPRYQTNEGGFRDETEALFRKLYGSGDHNEVRG